MIHALVIATTLLAGSHMTAKTYSLTNEEAPKLLPVQWGMPYYGGPPPYEMGPPQWEQGGPGWYGRRGMGGAFWGRDMDPDSHRMMRQWEFELGPYGGPHAPWMGRRWRGGW